MESEVLSERLIFAAVLSFGLYVLYRAGFPREHKRQIATPDTVADESLRHVWLTSIRPDFMPYIADDPILSPSSDAALDVYLNRFLAAERDRAASEQEAVQRAAVRLRRTAEFRRDYAVKDFFRPGMARALFMHGTNAGACIYFGDCGLRDRRGEPVLVGRTSLMVEENAPGRKPADAALPATHLRGAMFVIERVRCCPEPRHPAASST